MPFETLDYHLKRCVTWFQATPLSTSLHQMFVINLIYYSTSITSLRYYQSCPITFCTLITLIICLTRATLHQEHCARTLLTMTIARRVHTRYHLDIPSRITPIHPCLDVHTSFDPLHNRWQKPSRPPVSSGWVDRLAPVVSGLVTPRRQTRSFPARSLIWALWLCCVAVGRTF